MLKSLLKSVFNTIKLSALTLVVLITVGTGIRAYINFIESQEHKAMFDLYFYTKKNLPKYAPEDALLNLVTPLPPLIHLVLPGGNACSAFVVDNNYAITAAHCLSGEPKHNTAQSIDRKVSIPVETVGYNLRVDYGLIKGDFKDFKKFTIAPTLAISRATEGRMLAVCGFPEGQTPAVCTPALSLGVDGFSIVIKSEGYPGMSGGPVIDVESSVVVGVFVASIGRDYFQVSALTGFLGAMGIE